MNDSIGIGIFSIVLIYWWENSEYSTTSQTGINKEAIYCILWFGWCCHYSRI